MPYSQDNPPRLVTQDIGNSSQASWRYRSTDAPSVVAANGYVSNAKALGMKVGDTVDVMQVDGNGAQVAQAVQRVLTINANGSADFSDGTTVSLANAG